MPQLEFLDSLDFVGQTNQWNQWPLIDINFPEIKPAASEAGLQAAITGGAHELGR